MGDILQLLFRWLDPSPHYYLSLKLCCSETMSFMVFFPANRNGKWGINLCINDRLEQESGFFFNMKYFEDQVQGGEWEEVERYLSGFTKVDDNRYSMKIFFEIRKQKYLEALDKYVFCCVLRFVVIPLC